MSCDAREESRALRRIRLTFVSALAAIARRGGDAAVDLIRASVRA